jgi:hypothetical protein
VPSQTIEGQLMTCWSAGAMSQVPLPVQKLRKNWDWSTEQLVAQTVVAGQSRQPPLPSQVPSERQVVWADAIPWQVPVGSVPPLGTLVHAPSNPGTAQLRQESEQLADPQQNPSVQKRPAPH